mgnify:CR=1 FL=1
MPILQVNMYAIYEFYVFYKIGGNGMENIENDEALYEYFFKLIDEIGFDELFAIEVEAKAKNEEHFAKLKENGVCGFKVVKEHDVNMLEVEGLGYLKFQKKDLKKIIDVCNELVREGCIVDKQCGGHIHMDRSIFKKPRELWNVFEIVSLACPIFELMFNEEGNLPREGVLLYARDTFPNLKKHLPIEHIKTVDELYQFIPIMQDMFYTAFANLKVSEDYNTLEIRIANGTLSPKVWIENVILYFAIVKASINLENPSSENWEEKKKLKERLSDKSISIDRRSEFLLDLLFNNEQIKEIYRNRFKVNRELQIDQKEFEELYNKRNKKNLNNINTYDLEK